MIPADMDYGRAHHTGDPFRPSWWADGDGAAGRAGVTKQSLNRVLLHADLDDG